MVRSFRVAALIAFLACAAPGLGQSIQPEQFVTVREDGKQAQKCRVVKCWKEPDGGRLCEVQAVEGGEMMTIVDAAPVAGSSTPPGSRVFGWGKSKTSPPGVPVASAKAEVVKSWSDSQSQPRGILGKAFGSTSTAVAKNTTAPVSEMRQSWGKVETASAPEESKITQASGRPGLPVADKASGDPLERPDIYTTAPASMAPVKSDAIVAETTTPASATSRRMPLGMFSSRASKPVVVKESHSSKPQAIQSEVVSSETVPMGAPAPREPHVGVFAGLFNPRTVAPVSMPKPRPNMPTGMGSVGDAVRAESGMLAVTPTGSFTRLPNGQHTVVNLPGTPPMVSVPAMSSNAFTTGGQQQMAHGYYPEHQTLANAFTMPMPYRPLPVDETTMQRYTTNGLGQEGMGGAEYRPTMASLSRQPVPMMPMMAYYGAMMPAGVATASSQHVAGTTHHLAALRQSVMPSERERAVTGLVQVGWKADPQVVPALVLAAMTDPAPAVRVACVRALGEMNARTLPAVQALTALTKDHDARIRAEAEQVLPLLTK